MYGHKIRDEKYSVALTDTDSSVVTLSTIKSAAFSGQNYFNIKEKTCRKGGFPCLTNAAFTDHALKKCVCVCVSECSGPSHLPLA